MNSFSIISGTLVVLIGVVFPFAIYVKLSENRWYHYKNLFVIIMAMFFTITGFSAAVISVLDTVHVLDLSSFNC